LQPRGLEKEEPRGNRTKVEQRKKKAKTCSESDHGTEAVGTAASKSSQQKTYKGSKANHVNIRKSSNSIEEFQVVVTKGNTEVSNINKEIYPKGDG
jgi:hypothetical protein